MNEKKCYYGINGFQVYKVCALGVSTRCCGEAGTREVEQRKKGMWGKREVRERVRDEKCD